MEIVFLLVLPAAMWMHSWYLLGFFNNGRALGIVAAAATVALVGLVFFNNSIIVNIGSEGPLSALILLWAFYTALLAAVGLWGFDDRPLGFYGLFAGIVSLVYVLYYFAGDAILLDQGQSPLGVAAGTGVRISTVMGIDALMLAVAGILLFLYLGPPFYRMRTATGWVLLVVSAASAVLGALAALGLPLDT